MSTDRVIIESRGIDPDQMMFEGMDMSDSPTFAVSQVVNMLFAKSTHWLRSVERKGLTVLDGKKAGYRTASDARRFNLADLEILCHALLHNGVIDGRDFSAALNVVRDIGFVHGFVVFED